MGQLRLIYVSGCHKCPYCHDISKICKKIWRHGNGYQRIAKYITDQTRPDNCPLEKIGDAESRLKTCLAVREEELYYARQDAVKHIRAELDWYHKSYNSEYSDIDFKHRFIIAINADLKQAGGEMNS